MHSWIIATIYTYSYDCCLFVIRAVSRVNKLDSGRTLNLYHRCCHFYGTSPGNTLIFANNIITIKLNWYLLPWAICFCMLNLMTMKLAVILYQPSTYRASGVLQWICINHLLTEGLVSLQPSQNLRQQQYTTVPLTAAEHSIRQNQCKLKAWKQNWD